MDDCPDPCNFAIELGPQKHIDLPESIFIAASKAGVGELQADEWRPSSQPVATLPGRPCLPQLLPCPHPGMEHGHCVSGILVSRSLGLFACSHELLRNQGLSQPQTSWSPDPWGCSGGGVHWAVSWERCAPCPPKADVWKESQGTVSVATRAIEEVRAVPVSGG